MDKILVALKNARTQIRTLGTPTDDVNNAHLAELDEVIGILERPNPSSEKYYYWLLEVGVSDNWVADGADFTDEKVHDMLAHHWSHAYGHELRGKVLARPSDKAVATEMGYKSVAEYLKARED